MTSTLYYHNDASELYRVPLGAVPAGSRVTLTLDTPAPEALESCTLVISGDTASWRLPMTRRDGRWSTVFQTPDTPSVLWYVFQCTPPEGEEFTITAPDAPGWQLTVYSPGFDTPAWFRRTVLYQIFPDRFARGDAAAVRAGIAYHASMGRNLEFQEDWSAPVRWQGQNGNPYTPNDIYGGTLRAIQGRLPYLASLGVGAIYLNPIFEADSNHRYNTADYSKIDAILGTEADFRALCDEAEQRGIRILLDGVFSHTGADSVYFNQRGNYAAPGACQGPESPYYGWYHFDSFPDTYKTWWGFPSLPEIDKSSKSWQRYMVDGPDSILARWLGAGAGGYRLDVADELPDETLRTIRKTVKAAKADAPIIGEVWEDATTKISYGQRRTYALGKSLDSVMNYPLRDAVVDFALRHTDAHALCAFLLGQRLHYPRPMYYSLMNLLSSHDIPRIRTVLSARLTGKDMTREQQASFILSPEQDQRGRESQKACAALLFTLPGVPAIYYGDEEGMQGFADPFNRAPFRENPETGLRDWYARLASLRRENPALSTGHAAFAALGGDVLCVLRLIYDGQDALGCPGENGCFLFVWNRGAARHAVLDLYDFAGLDAAAFSALAALPLTAGQCLLTGTPARLRSGLLEATLPAESACLFPLYGFHAH